VRTWRSFVNSGRFEATADESRLRDTDASPSPSQLRLAKTRDPGHDLRHRRCRRHRPQLSPGSFIVLESTTYPGTTRDLMQPKLEAAGLT